MPASFGHVQRLALAGAARRAGLTVLRVVSETTAAALALAVQREADQTVLVVDLGGGALDVAVAELGDGVVEIKSTAGDARLGGRDWDERIVEHLVRRIRQRYDLDIADQPGPLQRLREAAEAAKIELSAAHTAEIRLPYLGVTAAGPVHVTEPLTRTAFEGLTRDLLNRCRAPIDEALADSGITMAGIDHVVLAGGASRMPAVGELVRGLTGGRAPQRGLAPEGVVAGAALQAGILAGAVLDLLVLDVIPLALGIELADGGMHTLLPRGTPLPSRVWTLVTTGADQQRSLLVRVCEGGHPVAASNAALAAFELTGLPPAARGMPRVEVVFDLDANGILTVTAEDRDTGHRRSVTVDRVSVDDAAQRGAPGDGLPVPAPPP